MKFDNDIPVYGNVNFRGKCPREGAEQATFINQLRKQYPHIAEICIHIENEGKRTHSQAMKAKAQGLVAGASDIIIPGGPSLVMEIKRQDHTQSKWQDGQIEYLQSARQSGSMVCVALGWEGALQAVEAWIKGGLESG